MKKITLAVANAYQMVRFLRRQAGKPHKQWRLCHRSKNIGPFMLLAALLQSCSQMPTQTATTTLSSTGVVPTDSQQLLVVVSPDWQANHGTLYQFNLDDAGQWVAGPLRGEVMLGRTGTAWGVGLHPVQDGVQKQEGDGKAPAGLFRLSGAFGAAPALQSLMPYQQMSADDYCIDVPDSPLYNATVNIRHHLSRDTRGSSEPMRRDLQLKPDYLYKKALFIDHNIANNRALVPQGGSCIFMHLKSPSGGATAGCTALDEPLLDAVLGWLDPAKQPVYLLLPQTEYQRLQASWQLPELPR